LDVTRLGDGGYVQAFLAQQSPLLQIFTGDITVCGRDAAVLAVLPVARGRRGADHADRESVQKVVSTGRAVVSEPVFSSFLNYPIIAICAPVTGPGNQVEGKGQAGWACLSANWRWKRTRAPSAWRAPPGRAPASWYGCRSGTDGFPLRTAVPANRPWGGRQSVATITALMVCIRFSAWSNTTECLLRNTSSVTSRMS